MSKSVNVVILLGNVGQDPEIRYTPTGTVVARVSLATARRVKSKKEGEWEERTTWHRLVFYGRTAEIVRDHVKKGAALHVIGELENRSWEDAGGEKRYITEVIGREISLLGGRKDGDVRPPEPAQADGGEDDLPF